MAARLPIRPTTLMIPPPQCTTYYQSEDEDADDENDTDSTLDSPVEMEIEQAQTSQEQQEHPRLSQYKMPDGTMVRTWHWYFIQSSSNPIRVPFPPMQTWQPTPPEITPAELPPTGRISPQIDTSKLLPLHPACYTARASDEEEPYIPPYEIQTKKRSNIFRRLRISDSDTLSDS